VRFRASDGTRLAGRLFGSGQVGVVLAHQIDNDQRAWFPFAVELAEGGYAALTFDFRGYCPRGLGGCSADGGIDDTWMDVLGAARFLREQGAERVWLVGASIGGDACLAAAAAGPAGLAGLITLSSPKFIVAYDIRPATMAAIAVPALFVAGRLDGDAPSSARAFFRWSPGPAELLLLPTGEHGTDLLNLADESIQERVRGAILRQLSRGR
jgi:pimeloyl-ACP methyl ester carboxylesterase